MLSDLSTISVDGEPTLHRPDLVVPVPTKDVVAVTANTRTVSLDGWKRDTLPGTSPGHPRPAYLPVGSATKLTAWAPSTTPARPAPASQVYDCDNYEPRPAKELGLRLDRETTAEGAAPAPDRQGPRRLHADHRRPTPSPDAPTACAWSTGRSRASDRRCASGSWAPTAATSCPARPINKEWIPFEQFITVDDVAKGLQVVLYANVGERNAMTTVTEYRNISIEALDPVLQQTVFPPEVPQATVDLAAGDHTLARDGRSVRLGAAATSARWRTATTPSR